MIQIVSPQPAHIEGLLRLSREFSGEYEWASDIPIGQIATREEARSKLFGAEVVQVLIAETEAGEMIGYIGVYEHLQVVYSSILIASAYRRVGVGKQLVESVFEQLSKGLVVEAWVGAFNEASLAVMGRFGFTLDRTLTDSGNKVHIFIRKA